MLRDGKAILVLFVARMNKNATMDGEKHVRVGPNSARETNTSPLTKRL